MLKRVRHPSGVDIQFDAKWHQYKMGGTALRSVSKLLDRYFPFDEKRILGIVSRKTGQPVEHIKRNWNRQALLGKNVHEYIECRLLGKPAPLFIALMEKQQARLQKMTEQQQQQQQQGSSSAKIQQPPPHEEEREEESEEKKRSHEAAVATLLHGEEPLYIPVAERAVEAIRVAYDIIGVEQVIAAPGWGLAGTVDFLAVNRQTKKILIGDWKTSGSVASNFRFGSFQTPCTGCLRHLPNDKAYRYAMQVIVYGEILKQERYFEKGFFDAALRQALQGQPLSSSSSGGAKRGMDKDALLAAYHTTMREGFEYGIVQLDKSDEGEVVVHFKGVQEANVLPPDACTLTFRSLLHDVMEAR